MKNWHDFMEIVRKTSVGQQLYLLHISLYPTTSRLGMDTPVQLAKSAL